MGIEPTSIVSEVVPNGLVISSVFQLDNEKDRAPGRALLQSGQGREHLSENKL